ncbi:MAG: DsbA family protein [Halioglobus sp.]
MNKLFFVAVLSFTMLLGAQTSWAASDDIEALQKDVAELKKGQEAMQKNLEEIKKLVQQGARPSGGSGFKPQDFSIAGTAVKGDRNATVTIVEFSDYQCPYCKRHAEGTMPELVKKYVDTGKAKIVMMENPIESIHKNAMGASQAALCAGAQGQYWEMHDIMFVNYKKLGVDELKGYAGEIGLETEDFNTCLDEKKYEDQVKANLSTARKLGVRGTPGFVVGLTDPKDPDKVKGSKYIKGAQGVDAFSEAIDELLKADKS